MIAVNFSAGAIFAVGMVAGLFICIVGIIAAATLYNKSKK